MEKTTEEVRALVDPRYLDQTNYESYGSYMTAWFREAGRVIACATQLQMEMRGIVGAAAIFTQTVGELCNPVEEEAALRQRQIALTHLLEDLMTTRGANRIVGFCAAKGKTLGIDGWEAHTIGRRRVSKVELTDDDIFWVGHFEWDEVSGTVRVWGGRKKEEVAGEWEWIRLTVDDTEGPNFRVVQANDLKTS